MSMFDRLADFEAELDRLESTLADLYAAGDQRAAADAGRRASDLRPVVEAYRAYRVREQGLSDAREMLESEKDPEMRDFLREEVGASEKAIDILEQDLKELLIPKDPNDGKNVIVEIRGGEGGDEGNIWAGDLYSMYLHYAETRRWKIELLSSQASDMGGFRERRWTIWTSSSDWPK